MPYFHSPRRGKAGGAIHAGGVRPKVVDRAGARRVLQRGAGGLHAPREVGAAAGRADVVRAGFAARQKWSASALEKWSTLGSVIDVWECDHVHVRERLTDRAPAKTPVGLRALLGIAFEHRLLGTRWQYRGAALPIVQRSSAQQVRAPGRRGANACSYPPPEDAPARPTVGPLDGRTHESSRQGGRQNPAEVDEKSLRALLHGECILWVKGRGRNHRSVPLAALRDGGCFMTISTAHGLAPMAGGARLEEMRHPPVHAA